MVFWVGLLIQIPLSIISVFLWGIGLADARFWIRLGVAVLPAVAGLILIRSPRLVRWSGLYMLFYVVLIGATLVVIFAPTPLGWTRLLSYLTAACIMPRLSVRAGAFVEAVLIGWYVTFSSAVLRVSAADLGTSLPVLCMFSLFMLVGLYFIENSARRDFLLRRLLELERAALAESVGEKERLLSELGELNITLRERSVELEAASRHKTEFLAHMSHELRTPLNAVIGFSRVLLRRTFGALGDKQEEYLHDIHASGQHLLSLINDILDLSKIEAGKLELDRAPFDLPAAIEQAVQLVRERASHRRIRLTTDLDPRLGEWTADSRKVRQVIINLLANAVKFTPEGGSVIVRAVPGDGEVAISVADDGIGIAPQDQEIIFEPFRQAGGRDGRREGTGLGLTLVRKLVDLHGGRVSLESEVGRGSTFTFTIPATPPAPSPHAAAVPRAEGIA